MTLIKHMIAAYVLMLSGSDGALTRTPESSTLIPGTLLRLNCSSTDGSNFILWRFAPEDSSTVDVTSGGAVVTRFTSYFYIDSTSRYDLVAQTSNANEFYCGTYTCFENEGGGASATATVAVASSPVCVVDKLTAAANESVTYTCSATAVCGIIDVSLSIEYSGVTVATTSNTVTWTVTAGDIANSSVTCMSTIKCPSVTIVGGTTTTAAEKSTSMSDGTIRSTTRECECLSSSVWRWLVAVTAVSSVKVAVCIVAMVLLIITCKRPVCDGQRKLALCIVPQILILVLALALVVISAIFFAKIRNDAELMNCGVLGDAKLDGLLIASMVWFAIVVVITVSVICIAVVFRRSEDDRKRWLTCIFAVVVLVLAMLCSAATAVWSVTAGEKIKDTCEAYAENWTWQILLIAFFASAAAGALFVILILFFVCSNHGRGIMKITTDRVELQQRNDSVDANGQNDLNKTEARKERNEVNAYENVPLDD